MSEKKATKAKEQKIFFFSFINFLVLIEEREEEKKLQKQNVHFSSGLVSSLVFSTLLCIVDEENGGFSVIESMSEVTKNREIQAEPPKTKQQQQICAKNPIYFHSPLGVHCMDGKEPIFNTTTSKLLKCMYLLIFFNYSLNDNISIEEKKTQPKFPRIR